MTKNTNKIAVCCNFGKLKGEYSCSKIEYRSFIGSIHNESIQNKYYNIFHGRTQSKKKKKIENHNFKSSPPPFPRNNRLNALTYENEARRWIQRLLEDALRVRVTMKRLNENSSDQHGARMAHALHTRWLKPLGNERETHKRENRKIFLWIE